MINSILFNRFRGFEEIELEGLRQITLISGKNNAGKSSILEGLFLAIDHIAPDSFIKINGFRGLPTSYDQSSLWEPMFFNLDTTTPLRISLKVDNQIAELEYRRDDSFVLPDGAVQLPDIMNQAFSYEKSSYALEFGFKYGDYTEKGHFVVNSTGIVRNIATNIAGNRMKTLTLTHFINARTVNNDGALAEWFGKLEIEGKKQKIIDILKLIEPTICDMSTIAYRGQIQLYVKKGSKLLPLKLAGDGINKLLFIVLAIVENPDSIILIDEIETGFHYSMYAKLWEVIASAVAESNCQIIATTHSYECIDGAVEGIEAAQMQDEFCYFRIEREDDKNGAFCYTNELLKKALATNMEVR